MNTEKIAPRDTRNVSQRDGMESITVKLLDEKRFNAYVDATRSPAAAYVSFEIGWYANDDETIIGVILVDTIDDDFTAIILGRDEGGRFRAIDLQTSVASEKEATEWLHRTIRWHTASVESVFPVGDKPNGIDLFAPIVSLEKQHPYFTRLNSDRSFTPAKAMVNEFMHHFIDIDGNFVEQFQSVAFDSRLWELYLFCYLNEEQLFIDRNHYAPDFIVKKYGELVAIEAVIVGRKEENPPTYLNTKSLEHLLRDFEEEHKNAMPIRFGSPLYSKLQKKYWELDHVKDIPLVFAIADFHDDQSMLWSSTALINYLYGVKHDFHYDENKKLIITPTPISTHKVGGKEIPSGFFFQPNAEHVSAILTSASGTISKFNRLGRQAGFGDKDIIMIRQGTYHDHDPNASVPKMFKYMVDESSEETWGEGVSMYHNPNAIHPVPEELFPSIAHHHFKNGQIVSTLPEFFVYASYTFNFRPQK